jgi:hypothetical protein
MRHQSLVDEPADTTCKYQHRKDLPSFVVDEGRSEHAAEFAAFTGLVTLRTKRALRKHLYSEKFDWERRQFDPVTNALAHYGRAGRSWVFIETFAGGVDGRRALVHGCLTRRYLQHCDSWTSSYRMVLALVDEMKTPPVFSEKSLCLNGYGDAGEVEGQARWDVFFCRLTGLQEYGWHAGVEDLMWASDGLNGSLSELDWDGVVKELEEICPKWTDAIINHAKENDEFFTQGADQQSLDALDE